MAEITMEGMAEMEVECDTVTYTFSFRETKSSLAKALNAVNTDVETFLKLLEDQGVDISQCRMEENYSGVSTYRDDYEEPCAAKRSFSWTTKLKPAVSTMIVNLIESSNLPVQMNENYEVINMDEIRKELLRKALKNSRDKAEIIAECEGKEILGIKSVKAPEDYETENYEKMRYGAGEICCNMEDSMSSRLQNKTIKLSENILVVWMMGD